MDISRLKADIKNRCLQDLYVFVGEEWKVQQIYIDRMAEVVGNKQYVDSINEIYNKLQNQGFFKIKKLYIIRDDKDIISNDKLQEQLLNGLIGENTVVLIFSQLDRRTKAFKTFMNKIITFDKMPLETLKKYVKREIKLSDNNIEYLINVCDYDYGRILLEIDKLKRYDNVDSAFDALLDEGVIYQPPQDAIFDFVDAVLKRDVNLSYWMLQNCIGVKESVLVMLSVLYNSSRQVLQVQACESNDITKSTGLNSWQIKHAKSRLNYYSIGELVSILRLIQELEVGIKTGTYEEGYVMDYLLTSIL